MSTLTYDVVLDRAQRLAPEDQLRLLADLAALVRHRIAPRPRRSILELQGLGKEMWRSIDVQAYVDSERALWGG